MDGAGSWTFAGELPVAISLRGVSLNSNIFMTGNIVIHKLGFINILILLEDTMEIIYILSFNSDDGTWEEVDQLQRNRYDHGANLVNFGDVMDYCQ